MAHDVGFTPVSLLVEFAAHCRPSSLPQLTEFGLTVDERTRNFLCVREVLGLASTSKSAISLYRSFLFEIK